MQEFYDADENKVVFVTSAREDDTVVLFEKHPAHPGGETFIGGTAIARAALTPKVVARIDARQARVLSDAEAEQFEKQEKVTHARRLAQAREDERERRRKLYVASVGTDKGFDALYKPA